MAALNAVACSGALVALVPRAALESVVAAWLAAAWLAATAQ